MSVPASGERGALAFAEGLLTLLGEGRFTATYKYAVILGLLDLCLERSDDTGAAPESVTTRQLAEKVVELYWRQAFPFPNDGVLAQSSRSQAKVLSLILRFREQTGEARRSISSVRRAHPKAWQRLIDDAEWVLVQMPLPKLQRLGQRSVPLLYQISWDDEVDRRDLQSPEFDNVIRLLPGVGDHLVRLAGLVRPIVERRWAAHVARLNSLKDSKLEEFLFGFERKSLAPVRSGLTDLQKGECFYCARPLSGPAAVDHFIPWSRYPNDGIENLVIAHPRCNSSKSDHLAASDHVERWVARAEEEGAVLGSLAADLGWDRDPGRTLGVGRSIYLRIPETAQLWAEVGRFVAANRGRLEAAFGANGGVA